MADIRIDSKEISDYLDKIGDESLGFEAITRGMRRGKFTLLNKIRENLTGKILNVDTGELRRRAFVDDPKVRGQEVELEYGSRPIAYARIHEFGGVITAKRAPFLTFQTKDGTWHRVRSVTIPERKPYRTSAAESLQDISDDVLLSLVSVYKRGMA